MSESSKEHIEQSPTAKPVPPATPSTPVPPATSSISSAPLARRPLIAAEIAKRKESEQQRKLRGSARAKAKKKQQAAQKQKAPPSLLSSPLPRRNKAVQKRYLSFANTNKLAITKLKKYLKSPDKTYLSGSNTTVQLNEVENELKKLEKAVANGQKDISDEEIKVMNHLRFLHKFCEEDGTASEKHYEFMKALVSRTCKRKREGLSKVNASVVKELSYFNNTFRPAINEYGQEKKRYKQFETDVEKYHKLLAQSQEQLEKSTKKLDAIKIKL